MSKKSFTLLIIFLIAIFVAIGWYLYTRTDNGVTDPGTNQTSDLFPFGPGGGNTSTGTSTSTSTSTQTEIDLSTGGEPRTPRLRQISFVPTAGAIASSTASSTIIRYIERATGHIYETESEKTAVTKISTITIPKVHEALFTQNATRLLIRYFKDDSDIIRTFYAKIATPQRPEQALEGLFLPDGIRDMAVFANKVFYLVWKDTDAQGILADIDGSNKSIIFNSSFGEWATSWTSQNLITLGTKPGNATEGSSYVLNPATGDYTKALSGIAGLETRLNSDGTLMLYSGRNNSLFGTSVVDIKTSRSQRLGVATLADKCVWSSRNRATVYCAVPKSPANGAYPDDWHKGKTSFDDALWKINAVSGETEELLDTDLSAGISMDMINLSLDQKENIILFTNKKDMTVWRYRLND
ncbi:MAG TPA: hypothetical protein VGE35_00120 [Candidatus Paceibacterota bacterium]